MTMYDSTNDVFEHKKKVYTYMKRICDYLIDKAILHDNSKLKDPEKTIFDTYTQLLKKTEYGSDEYKKNKEKISDALEHHHALNDHHLEHFKNNTNEIDLFILVEIICDWIAASENHNNGEIYKSIEIEQQKSGFSDEMKSLFINTVEKFKKINKKEEIKTNEENIIQDVH